jgi:putative membrane protein
MIYAICLLAAVAGAVLLASKVLPGVQVKNTGTLIAVAVVFGVLNLVFGWGLKILLALITLPAVLLTGGLFYWLIVLGVDCLLVWMTDKLLSGFTIKNFSSLFGTAFLISVAMWIVGRFF